MTMHDVSRPARLKVLLGAVQMMECWAKSWLIFAKGVNLWPL